MWRTKTPKIEELHKRLYALESICIFMGMVRSEITESKPNFTTKDYNLHQFQCWVGREIDRLKFVERDK